MRIFTCCCFFALLLNACIQERQTIPAEVIGLAPIYASDDWQDIQILAPQSIENLGKIYYKSPFIYATERGRGIHIFDNSDPTQPKAEAFLQIAGNSDLAIRNGILYANNVNDLVGINISDLTDIEVVERLANVYQVTGSDFPENYIGYFECVDPNLGQVVGWFETTIREPECWREQARICHQQKSAEGSRAASRPHGKEQRDSKRSLYTLLKVAIVSPRTP